MHRDKRLRKLARQHKQIERKKGNYRCADCKSVDNLESDHVLSKRYFPWLQFKLWNLRIRCKPCNQKKGTKVYYDWHTLKVLFRAVRNKTVFFTLIVTGFYYAYYEMFHH